MRYPPGEGARLQGEVARPGTQPGEPKEKPTQEKPQGREDPLNGTRGAQAGTGYGESLHRFGWLAADADSF